MSQKQAFTCDECGIQKKETNHWVLGHAGYSQGEPFAMVMPWSDADSMEPMVKHFCGGPHAAVWISKRINEWRESQNADTENER